MPDAFILSEHIREIVLAAFLSMVPTFEGRYAVLVVQPLGMPALPAFLLALVFSTLPMPFIFWFLKPVLKWLYTLPYKPVQRFAAWVERRSMKKAGRMDAVGLLSLFAFVAVPLPGTGVWTGSGIATLMNMKKGPAMIAIFLGNVVACLITTLSMFGLLSIF